MFYHSEMQFMLMVYVDYLKMSGPAKHVTEGWKRIRSGLDIDDPVFVFSPLNLCFFNLLSLLILRQLLDIALEKPLIFLLFLSLLEVLFDVQRKVGQL